MTYFTPTPRAFRPKRSLFIAIAPLLESDAYITMTCQEFCAQVMKTTHGSVSPKEAALIYEELLEEAGVKRDWQFKLPQG